MYLALTLLAFIILLQCLWAILRESCSDWLPEQVRWVPLACSGLRALILHNKNLRGVDLKNPTNSQNKET